MATQLSAACVSGRTETGVPLVDCTEARGRAADRAMTRSTGIASSRKASLKPAPAPVCKGFNKLPSPSPIKAATAMTVAAPRLPPKKNSIELMLRAEASTWLRTICLRELLPEAVRWPRQGRWLRLSRRGLRHATLDHRLGSQASSPSREPPHRQSPGQFLPPATTEKSAPSRTRGSRLRIRLRRAERWGERHNGRPDDRTEGWLSHRPRGPGHEPTKLSGIDRHVGGDVGQDHPDR